MEPETSLRFVEEDWKSGNFTRGSNFQQHWDFLSQCFPMKFAKFLSTYFFEHDWSSIDKRSYAMEPEIFYKIKNLPEKVINRLYPEIGYLLALLANEDGVAWDRIIDVELFSIKRNLSMKNAKLKSKLRSSAQLFKLLLEMERTRYHSDRTTRRGFENVLWEMAAGNVALWCDSLPLLLRKANTMMGLVEAITLLLAKSHPKVQTTLEKAATADAQAVRTRAYGLKAALNAFETPQSRLFTDLTSLLAGLVDGSPVFPHPLELRSSIWIGSRGTEQFLRDNIKRAISKFSHYCRDQLGLDEEPLTRSLVMEIEVAFRDAGLQIKALGTSSASTPSTITAEHRQLSKKEEDPLGFDLAFLVNGVVTNSLEIESVEAIQVKKPERVQGGNGWRDAWRIDVAQNQVLLDFSQTAVYWLFGKQGEVFVVPARLLRALIRGSKAESQGSKTVGYNDIRSMIVPLEHFLIDLALGIWLGQSSPEKIAIARGEVDGTKPRLIFEVSIMQVEN